MSLSKAKESASIPDTAGVPQVSALSDLALKMNNQHKASNTVQDTAVELDHAHLSHGKVGSQYMPDTSWAAYRVYLAIVFSEALLFGLCPSWLPAA